MLSKVGTLLTVMSVASYMQDWHNLDHVEPASVRICETEADVINAVRSSDGPIAVRATGHGQGSTLVPDGLVIDVNALRDIISISPDSGIVVGAGCSFHDVLDALRPLNLTTVTQTDWQGLSVGGIVSVGGLGPGLFRHGLVIDSVTALRIVTGNGAVHDVGPDDDLFRAALGGLGQFGVILRVRLRVAPRPARARLHRCVTTLDGYLRADYSSATLHNVQTFPRLNQPGTFVNLESAFADFPHDRYPDAWLFLHEYVSFYNDGAGNDGAGTVLRDEDVLAKYVRDVSYDEWVFRLDDKFGRRAPHVDETPLYRPWFEAFIGGQDAVEFIDREVLRNVTADDNPSGSLMITYPVSSMRSVNSDSISFPDGFSSGIYFGWLRVTPDKEQAKRFRLQDDARRVRFQERSRGYLSSAMPRSVEQWRLYLGEDRLVRLRLLADRHDARHRFSWRMFKGQDIRD
ncbi:FAD-binding PCMH-type domain-containing protein [Plasmodiophora brassicae]|uniref:FAD-binding PCMH-type domain-containing protein n=1 Tax=Plasmodiophora brassicae TaxID=37360 RepID=A0A0G4IU83_PLABS|nr:hypothetical protein PBRA_007022 [Plasmodiophora brassicae]SPQ92981.1 unnamed protein product [Plasmodiophora brassicae]